MWENFGADGANKSLEMDELISRNLHSRMTPFDFENDILDKASHVPRGELRKLLEGERFLKKNSLHDDDIGTGDLFKEEYENGGETKVRYYLNIRALCDLMRDESLRIGRLLPPYITRIQQRYSLYMQRQGLPRIPNDAIFEAAPVAKNEN